MSFESLYDDIEIDFEADPIKLVDVVRGALPAVSNNPAVLMAFFHACINLLGGQEIHTPLIECGSCWKGQAIDTVAGMVRADVDRVERSFIDGEVEDVRLRLVEVFSKGLQAIGLLA